VFVVAVVVEWYRKRRRESNECMRKDVKENQSLIRSKTPVFTF
jgi:sensor domain CHASE-containing protein